MPSGWLPICWYSFPLPRAPGSQLRPGILLPRQRPADYRLMVACRLKAVLALAFLLLLAAPAAARDAPTATQLAEKMDQGLEEQICGRPPALSCLEELEQACVDYTVGMINPADFAIWLYRQSRQHTSYADGATRVVLSKCDKGWNPPDAPRKSPWTGTYPAGPWPTCNEWGLNPNGDPWPCFQGHLVQ